ncbi:MAG: hypothetical protein ACREJN_15065 [Nitrospiraceae bacterium]
MIPSLSGEGPIGCGAAAHGGIIRNQVVPSSQISLKAVTGIEERSPIIRARIGDGLEFPGVETDEVPHEADEPVMFNAGSSVTVRVISTDEARDIA